MECKKCKSKMVVFYENHRKIKFFCWKCHAIIVVVRFEEE
jgi:hypothetical protein